MNLDLGAGRHLVLAGGANAILWTAVGICAFLLLLALYRYELRLVSRRAGLTLLATRLLAALVLVGSLFEPIAELRYDERVRGRVILGVDRSLSMATADPAPSVARRGVSSSDPVPTISRQAVSRLLLEGDWIKKIAVDHQIESLGFARDTVDGSIANLAGSPAADSARIDPARLITDWNPMLARALKASGNGPVLGVVLLTDGCQNGPVDPGRSADRLAALGIPVFPIFIGSTVAPKDVAIASVNAPETVMKGDVAVVEAVVKLDGIPGVEVPIVLERPGSSALKQIVRGQPDGSRPVATFRVPMEKVGPIDITVTVGPLVGDVRPENDRRAVAVQVIDDKAKVLLVDGETRWEFRYLRNAFARDPRVSVETIVFRQPISSDGLASYKKELPSRGSTGQLDPLGAFDAIFVGDVDALIMPADLWSRLEEYVSKRGGTLIMAPGRQGWSNAVGKLEPVTRLLPVMDPRPLERGVSTDPEHPSLVGGVSIEPSTAVSKTSWPMLQLTIPERNAALWRNLPRLPWVLAGKAKPGATVLASCAGADPSGENTVVAAQAYGLGKVLWVGTDSTWRWRFRAADAYHHRFWGQVVRWAASAKLSAGDQLVRFGPERSRISIGENVRLEARFADHVTGIGPEFLAIARVFKAPRPGDENTNVPENSAAIIPLNSVPGHARTFAGFVPQLSVGRYLIRLDAPGLASSLKGAGPSAVPEATLEVADAATSELVELAASRQALDRLAATTGGRVFTPDEVDEIPKLVKRRATVKAHVEETPLWDRPWTLSLFFAVLTLEWILRKRAGLP